MNLFTNQRLWTWAALGSAMLMIAVVAWLHVQHHDILERAANELNQARQARIELVRGFLHVSLSGAPDSPYNWDEGVALLRQSIRTLAECAETKHYLQDHELERFRQHVTDLETRLTKWEASSPGQSTALAELRIALHGLDMQAAEVDRRIQAHVDAMSRKLDLQFAIAMLVASLFLAFMCAMVYVAGRNRAQASASLMESEQRWQFALEGAGEGLWDWDARTNRVYFSSKWKSMLGYADAEIGDTLEEWSSRVHPDDLEQTMAEVQEHLNGSTSGYASEHRLRCKDGTYKWILDRGMVISRGPKGEPLRVIGTHADITERRNMEERLRRNEERLNLALSAAHMGVWEWDIATDAVFWSEECQQIIGESALDNTQDGFYRLIHPDDVERVRMETTAAMQSRDPLTMEYRLVRPDKRVIWIFDRGQTIFDAAGKPVRMVGALVDITARKQAELALRESEERFRKLVEEAPDAIFIQTHKCFAYGNRACAELFGAASMDELIGKPVLDCFHPDCRDAVVERIRRLNEEGENAPLNNECILRPDGAVVPVEVSAIPFVFEREHGALVFARDVSERKKAEMERERLQVQLLHSQKMESIGRLAGGVAHDFNNMLGVINGYAELLLDEMSTESPLRTEITEIRNAGQRAARLTQQLLAFSRKQILLPQVIDLNVLMAEMEHMLRRLLGADIEFHTTLAPDLGAVKADPGQIEQVIVNLAINARDAMPRGGKLAIETRNLDLDEAYASRHVSVLPGSYVMLSVTDNGVGMSEEVMSRVFDPFFTTKERGKGTGLGLSTAYGTIQQSGGAISVYSEPGRGTTFKVLLPRVNAPVAEQKPATQGPVERGTESILLVEDEESVRNMAERVLSRSGYHVIAAVHGMDALSIMGQPGLRVDLLLTDMIMPGMNGRELAAKLIEGRPDLKVLFMSGYADNAMVENGLLEAGASFINKPFGVAELVRRVQEVLGAPNDRVSK
jgi:two-component system cell cycle sensor histidine kinase/response regulator CckA